MHCLDNLLASHSPINNCSEYFSIINFESNISVQHHGINVLYVCVFGSLVADTEAQNGTIQQRGI